MIQSLAQAHAMIVLGCGRAPMARGADMRGRPVPWVLGIGGDVVVIAEPWSRLHRIHRRKRGFSAVCDRLRALCALAASELGSDEPRLEIWGDELEPDTTLIAKIEGQLDRRIEVYDGARIKTALNAVRDRITPHEAGSPNTLLGVLAWMHEIDGLFDKADPI